MKESTRTETLTLRKKFFRDGTFSVSVMHHAIDADPAKTGVETIGYYSSEINTFRDIFDVARKMVCKLMGFTVEREMRQVLQVSTVHISRKERDMLEESARYNLPEGNPLRVTRGDDPIIVYSYLNGYILYVPPAEEIGDLYVRMVDFGYGQSLIKIFDTASKLGCINIQFDSDGPEYDDFSKYDWNA